MSTAIVSNGAGAVSVRSIEVDSPPLLQGDIITNPAMFDHVQRFARLLASSAFTPKHLKGGDDQRTVANCFRVAAQAIRWGYDPFAVADETYEVHGRLGYQGKLIIAVVNSRANLKGRLRFDYSGSGANMTVTVTGQFADEDSPRTVSLSVHQAKTSNEMWTKDPEQKLAYSGAIRWARRHCPEVVMGVQSVEDLERIADSEAAKKLPAAKTLDALIAPPKSEEVEHSQQPEQHDEGKQVVAEESHAEPDEPVSDPTLPFEMALGDAQSLADCDAIERQAKDAVGAGKLNAADAATVLGWINDRRTAFEPKRRK